MFKIFAFRQARLLEQALQFTLPPILGFAPAQVQQELSLAPSLLLGLLQGVECELLRKALATGLVQLAERMAIVPTLALEKAISLGQGPCFYFYELPDNFRRGLVEAQITMTLGGHPETSLAATRIVVEGFASSYRRACEYAGRLDGQKLLGIGWAEIAAAFQTQPWFAKKPDLLNLLASTLKEEQILGTVNQHKLEGRKAAARARKPAKCGAWSRLYFAGCLSQRKRSGFGGGQFFRFIWKVCAFYSKCGYDMGTWKRHYCMRFSVYLRVTVPPRRR
jgi:hypothetical protein